MNELKQLAMDFSPLVPLGFAFIFFIFVYLYLKDTKYTELATPENVASHISPASPGQVDKQNARDALIDYSSVLPPSRRHALLEILTQLPQDHPLRQRSEASILEVPNLPNNISVPLRLTDGELQGPEVTPTGFTVEEIRQLGDFPDYATLGGIPLPPAYEGFDISRALPRPYRPFRWAYHQTMSLAKMEPEWWLELEKEYKSKIEQRKELYAKNGRLVLNYLPGSEMACKELMEMAVQFLCARYPMYFCMEKRNNLNVLKNSITNIETFLDGSIHPLLALLEHIPEDFAVMLRDPDTGLYHFRAGVICSALGWSVDSKIGKRLHEVHGPVPDYNEKMRFSMDRYFAKKLTDRAIQRGSWGFEVDTPLFMPPGDPHEKYRDYQDANMTLSRLHLRVDWQTLRRLPLTGAIVFNFKGIFTALEEFRDEPYIPALALKVLNEGKANIMAYKNAWHTEHVAGPALKAWQEEQEENGTMKKNWQVETLDESPFYPGWEKKWKRQQGF